MNKKIKTGKRTKPLCPKRLECIRHSSLIMLLKMSNIKSLPFFLVLTFLCFPSLTLIFYTYFFNLYRSEKLERV
ncbi:predicted protein [Methanosarcina acetivorans C2A]|uniref:Uncharacterized protein n=1 Tax=Methanosarcina acetivorans (strain ATCC 35395 / DSM 2834 / JCM 12185 / C2A) TaxID=188937 RepID=Q8TNR6_METAC|nr:predicted protein [Methanosarcina acetivorans C2A]